MKTVAEWLRSHRREESVTVEIVGRPEVHGAEPPRIVQGNPRAALDIEHHMVMFLWQRQIVVKAPCNGARDQDPPRHAQMHQKRLAAVEIGEQVFRPPPERRHQSAFEPHSHPRRKRPAQPLATHVRALDPVTLQYRHETAAHRFDFRQFGHGASSGQVTRL